MPKATATSKPRDSPTVPRRAPYQNSKVRKHRKHLQRRNGTGLDSQGDENTPPPNSSVSQRKRLLDVPSSSKSKPGQPSSTLLGESTRSNHSNLKTPSNIFNDRSYRDDSEPPYYPTKSSPAPSPRGLETNSHGFTTPPRQQIMNFDPLEEQGDEQKLLRLSRKRLEEMEGLLQRVEGLASSLHKQLITITGDYLELKRDVEQALESSTKGHLGYQLEALSCSPYYGSPSSTRSSIDERELEEVRAVTGPHITADDLRYGGGFAQWPYSL
ncbi:hypothetical protein CC2G_012212 [Coprinopsis cinerea AmutBmut pab1-1]|nr:hypothetical protein CC2G_012212 [Coprinopsis cinerea AmutBmut pab1-1]